MAALRRFRGHFNVPLAVANRPAGSQESKPQVGAAVHTAAGPPPAKSLSLYYPTRPASKLSWSLTPHGPCALAT